ncbi:invasion associated locus B family protein [Hoeflea prorocentri]|uniref:Invasion associated locus B family protein n=1 Tax=Hoeflea prorocentri TaxID=1922333 RepID=A0A9X3UJL2_9HYPH|nr:invasion associated locus B family protein [Hoeflea prorocentri]MCY6381776.1 invasion associated locus B family protein [Hoeflea prorocentri]MDA5399576.1 invasion associated locus B family protein [Hoeflea prorocentri]
MRILSWNIAAKSLVLALVALTAIPLGMTSAKAQDNGDAAATTTVQPMRIANGTRFGAWRVNCEAIAVNETACVLSQRLVRTSDNVFLAELLAFWSGDGSKSYLAARVPNGVYFPSGFALKREDSDDRQNFVWQSCSRDICEALLELPIEDIEALEGSENIIAGYRPSLRSQPLVFRTSMQGASEGLNALKASMLSGGEEGEADN